ncbi:MerR family transcriptional regulator [Mycetocola spongiae]|uniref:MerR family transcriptional regulator n=1 Tax=Mycetocola spongiae TaxID=2859226 RepID=UPI001CF309ED|nr:MerR family transcriptional regulator [Mycetocola spongiae]UCR87837.1 MerR family transcriptional regulator [Mycetocola spongiae]
MATLSIGDFSRATHLGVRALRNYHRLGLLIPSAVDERTGYRRYGVEQLREALLIKRFRDLDLPLEDIRRIVGTADLEKRSALLEQHLARLRADLERVARATDSIFALLSPAADSRITLRTAPELSGMSITAQLDSATASAWFQGATAELVSTVRALGIGSGGPVIGLYDTRVFTAGRGRAVLALESASPRPAVGRVEAIRVPEVELCTTIHRGSHYAVDEAYARLAAHVAEHEIAVPGPLRETYLTGPADTPEPEAWVTEIGWPVFRTRQDPGHPG